MKILEYLIEPVGIDSLTGLEVPRVAVWTVNIMIVTTLIFIISAILIQIDIL